MKTLSLAAKGSFLSSLWRYLIIVILVFPFNSIQLPATATAAASESGSTPAQQKAATNRLSKESSPYLLQHATNPVNWYPWGPEAFEKARRENKPVFLSIGYSTCHWCHVMEKESFADAEVAALLNTYFVSVKVDREERPDIDRVYMAVTQAITGRGGWPNNLFLTPDKKPFYAGTYFPKHARWGLPGLMDLLPKVAQVWENDRQSVLEGADRLTAGLAERNDLDPGKALNSETLAAARELLVKSYDTENGGFTPAPKFPTPHKLTWLLRRYHHGDDQQALAMVEQTLTRMRLGGIYDQIGFGFHRYATDAQWRVPHFEKMLYDQALLAVAYTEAYQATGKPIYARTVREIFAYVLRDMTSPEGGFYSAEDADSEGEEGKFYLWTTAQIRNILTGKTSEFVLQTYNLKTEGNFISPETDQATGSNILYLQKPPPELAAEQGISEAHLLQRIENSRQRLFRHREKRPHPFKDDKILTDWNALMIAALAKAGKALGEPRYISAAEKAAGFILRRLQDDSGRLMKRYRHGNAGLPAHLDDYAFTIWGLLELYEATFTPSYLHDAIRLTDQMKTHFWDGQNGGLFMTADDSEKLFMRSKQIDDGAIPSGNSVAALNLLRLGHITGQTAYLDDAEQIAKAFSERVSTYPPRHAHLMMALEFALNTSYEVVVSGKPGADDTAAMLAALQRPFAPAKIVVFRPDDADQAAEIIRMAPYTKYMVPIDGKSTAYVCTNFVCKLPTTDISEMIASLKGIDP